VGVTGAGRQAGRQAGAQIILIICNFINKIMAE
jgi:hypothetical protein